MRSAFVDVFADLARALTGGSWDWYLFGGQAALIYGCYRLTVDVDVTVLPRERPVTDLLDALAADGIGLRVADQGFVEREHLAPCLHLKTGITVDVVIGHTGLEELFFERAVVHTVAGVELNVCTPADLVVMKILSRRGKDLEDARTVVDALEGALDQTWVTGALREVDRALGRPEFVPIWLGLLQGRG